MAADDGSAEAGCCDPKDGLGLRFYDVSRAGGTCPRRRCSRASDAANPTAVADLREGETVLDLGRAAGSTCCSRRSGSARPGKAYGLDMTDEMLELARANAAQGRRDERRVPARAISRRSRFADGTVDVVISNCVINLSTDKPKVVAEMFRVLRAGGRLGISDVVAANELARRPTEPSAGATSAASPARCRSRNTTQELADVRVHGHLDRADPRACRPDVRGDRAGAQGLVVSAGASRRCCSSACTTPGGARWPRRCSSDHAAGRVVVRSAGSTPADEINPAVVEAMAEFGIDLSTAVPKPLTDRGGRGGRRRGHDGLRRRVPGLPRQALPGLGAGRSRRAGRWTRCARSATRSTDA